MRYKIDHDYHIHSQLSTCSGDPGQTPERILEYAKEYGLKKICITDHYWDDTVYSAYGKGAGQTTAQIKSALPLPRKDGIRFLFGAETEMDRDFTIGVGKEIIEELDFIIVPLNHLHMSGFSCRGDEDAAERAELIVRRFDALLQAHGYRRSGLCYAAERPNTETLAFFCHFGLSCVLLSHLMNCSPMVLWQGLCMAPSSVTTVYTEERRPGIAAFRTAAVGDISHLYARQVPPSFAARFCECYGDGTRID